MPDSFPLLEIEHLHTRFHTREGVVHAVEDVSLSLAPGETLGVVGESGCGKSVLALSILRLVACPPGEIVSGAVRFLGQDLLSMPERALRKIRGNDIAMIFQEPMTALNPVLTVGYQVAEAVMLHRGLKRRAAHAYAVEMLRQVHIPEAERRAREYPHQLSGGMRQRVMIAMALACHPQVLIADEPTTALDVTIQAQILVLMQELKQQSGAAILIITHDLGVIAEMAQRVVVMYAGRKVEEAPVEALFARPQHAYTEGLLRSMPRLDSQVHSSVKQGTVERLQEIPGMVPSLREHIVGCAFAPRCAYADARCHQEIPPWEERTQGHFSACWHAARLGHPPARSTPSRSSAAAEPPNPPLPTA